MDFSVFHRYRYLASLGEVPAILCPDDNAPLTIRANKFLEPVFWCSWCNTTYNPGARVYQDMKKAVDEADN